jgi:oligopeptide transport system ATP-binding protein
VSKLNRNTENQEHASHLPEHGPIDENGKEVLLSLKNVDITFGKGDNAVRAVKNATFDIHKGETFSLVGESGSGKTTIGRAVIRVLSHIFVEETVRIIRFLHQISRNR